MVHRCSNINVYDYTTILRMPLIKGQFTLPVLHTDNYLAKSNNTTIYSISFPTDDAKYLL